MRRYEEMKKLILRNLSILLLFTLILTHLSFFTYADTVNAPISNQANSKEELYSENILSFSCIYDAKSKSVNIKGTMNHDAFALYGNSTLLIYLIPAGKTEHEIINDANSLPIAQASVSISFAFSFKVASITERYSRYAIFIRTADGKYILTTEAQYAETDGKFEHLNDKNKFKGLSGNYSSSISEVKAQNTIIPVYLDILFNEDSSGYLYHIDDCQISFNKSYIDELDSQIRSLSLFNTEVYLQFLLRSDGIASTSINDLAEYALPNTFEEQTTIQIHAATDFLVSRYLNGDNGVISGIVLGKAWDNAPKYNSFKDISFEQYVLMCGNYTAIVSNAARDINPKIDIVLSFDANGFYIEENSNNTSNNRFSTKALLTALMKYFDASSYSGIKCSLLFEVYETPFDITPNNIQDGVDINKQLDDNKFYIGQQNIISVFLKELSSQYKSTASNYNILWIPNKELYGNALCAAYAYAFYELLSDNNVIGFNVEFSSKAENFKNLTDLLFILKSIDSNNEANSNASTESLLSFFKKSNWSEVIGTKELTKPSTKTYYLAEPLTHLPNKLKGEFCYFDFSKAFLADGWINGVGCEDIKIDYLLSSEKALKANFNLINNDFCDLIYRYEYAENISYTPYIKFDLEVVSDQISPLYEIRFVFNSKDAAFETKSVIKGNQRSEIILNMTNAKDFSLLNSVKISLRSLDDSVESSTLCIRNITGYSKKYTNQELKDFVEKERDKQHNNNDADYSFWFKFGVVAIIIVASAIFGFILILFIKKNNPYRRKE